MTTPSFVGLASRLRASTITTTPITQSVLPGNSYRVPRFSPVRTS